MMALFFAKGEKEDLLSDHGKLYCAYTLINEYLGAGEILSRYNYSGTHRHGGQVPISRPFSTRTKWHH